MDTSNSELIAKLQSPEFKAALKAQPDRSFLLPHLFQFRGQPFGLKDHPQFRVMYPKQYCADTVFLCGRQIGKTVNLAHSELLDAQTVTNFHVLYVAPQELQSQRYNMEYLNPATKSSKLTALRAQLSKAKTSLDLLQNVNFKTFSNGGNIQLAYAKTSSDRVRGVYADRIDFDEVQDQLMDHIPVISESLTASGYGVRVFTGTAKTTDNTIEGLWQKSAQCEWVMRCHSCNHYNIPNLEGEVLKMIKATGVHCVKCGAKINVREGEFVPAYRERMDTFRGYHIPQIIIPHQVENPARWARLLTKFLRNPLPNFLTEALGISSATGARLITREHILAASVLPPMEDLRKKLSQYIHVIGGVDWGGAEVTSFTVHTILGVKIDGKFDVLYARRYAGFDPSETLQSIAKAHRHYNCSLIAADFGNGFTNNILLEKMGLKVIQIFYTSQRKLMAYSPILGHMRWLLDRTTAMELTFMAIRFGRIRFPPPAEFDIYTPDLLSPFEDITESGGFVSRKFLRNPAAPDDFCHALVFASILAMRRLSNDVADIVPGDALMSEYSNAGPLEITHVDPKDFFTGSG